MQPFTQFGQGVIKVDGGDVFTLLFYLLIIVLRILLIIGFIYFVWKVIVLFFKNGPLSQIPKTQKSRTTAPRKKPRPKKIPTK